MSRTDRLVDRADPKRLWGSVVRQLREGNMGYLLLGATLTAIYILPFYWLVKITLTWPQSKLFGENPSLLLTDPKLFNFVRVFAESNFVQMFMNSVIITALAMGGVLVFNSLAGYALTLDFPGRRLVLMFYVGVLFIPIYVTILPGFLILRELGLLNTHVSVALPLMTTVIGTFLFKNSFEAIPDAVTESARLDGASELYIVFGVLWPSSKAAVATNIILTYLQAWNNFIWPLVMLSDRSMNPLPLGLANFTSNYSGYPALGYAFALITVAPVLVSFFLLQKYFISGVVRGTVKQ
jgi:ABC-type glycerol-3-phosphate transport system permease component